MAINLDEFRRYLRIDKHSLDDELVSQSELLFKVAEAYLDAAATRDELKERLAVVDAQLDAQVRADLEKNDTKATEAMVKSLVTTHKRHEVASAAYLAARHEANLLQAMKESFKDRGFHVRDLVELYTSQYYDTKSVQGTNSTDQYQYEKMREKMARQRSERANER